MEKFVPSKRNEVVATASTEVMLDGNSMTPDVLLLIARGSRVRIASGVSELITRAHAALLNWAARGQKIYGLTVGVGQNKDRAMVAAMGQLTPEIIAASKSFNIDLIDPIASASDRIWMLKPRVL